VCGPFGVTVSIVLSLVASSHRTSPLFLSLRFSPPRSVGTRSYLIVDVVDRQSFFCCLYVYASLSAAATNLHSQSLHAVLAGVRAGCAR